MLADYNLAAKTALVTGVSRRKGIGAAVAMGLAKAGANVFTTYYRPYDALMSYGSQPEEAEEILRQLQAEGITAGGIEADLADPDAPHAVFDAAEALIGPIDILINNATQDIKADIYRLSSSLLDSHYAINIRGTALLCAEFARRHDGSRPGGRIISLTSGQSLHPMPDSLPYIISKGAIEALTISLSATLAGKGITVNAVDPGGTDTGWMDTDLYAAIEAKAPLGRVGTPEDAMRTILFLASSQAAWITGQIIHARGGQ